MIQVILKEDQASGAFNNGEILENKPIGFPQDGGQTKPYSNLFYWLTPGRLINPVQLDYTHTKDLKYVVLFLKDISIILIQS